MRATLLIVLVASLAVLALAQPAAPIIKRNNLAGDITSCPAGQGLATGSRPYKCAPCLAGFYKADTTLTGCLPCAINSWSPQGSASCYGCPHGTSTEGVANSPACTECAYGTRLSYSWPGDNAGLRCLPCPKNEYQPLAGKDTCLKCPVGMTTNNAEGSGECYAATGGGNTIDSAAGATPAGAAAPAKSLLQVLAKRAAAKPATKGVKPASEAPVAPQIVKRASYKGRATPAPGAKASATRASVEAAAKSNAKAAKASKAKSSKKAL